MLKHKIEGTAVEHSVKHIRRPQKGIYYVKQIEIHV